MTTRINPPEMPAFRPHSNGPLYLMRKKVLKSRHETAFPRERSEKSSLFEFRAKTSFMPQREKKDSILINTALDQRMRLITKKVYDNISSPIRSPKQLLSSMSLKYPDHIKVKEEKKRDILSKTGGLNLLNLKSLMNYHEDVDKDVYYSLTSNEIKKRNNSSYSISFKNYKYKKPDSLYTQIFNNEKFYPKKKPSTAMSSNSLENCLENLNKKVTKENFQFKNQEKLSQNQLTIQRKESEKKPTFFQEILQEISEFLEKNKEDFFIFIKPKKEPFLLDISEIGQHPKNFEKEVLAKLKEPSFTKEFLFLWTVSKKIISFLQKVLPENLIETLKTHVYNRNGIILIVLKRCFSGFKNRSQLINDRILLTMGVNPLNPLLVVPKEKYYKLVRLFYIMNHTTEELIDFSIAYFRIDEENKMEKTEFFLLLKTLTQQIDERFEKESSDTLKLEMKIKRKSLFENFMENFYMTGVLKKDHQEVDFVRFKQVYLNYQMNIYDLIDLIFGRV